MEEGDEDSWAMEIDQEISILTSQITKNEVNLEELKSQQLKSTSLIVEAQSKFQSTGQNFIRAKEACDMIEDLKEMLTEKSETINDILAKKLKLEKDIGSKVKTQIIAHITEIFRELKEHQ